MQSCFISSVAWSIKQWASRLTIYVTYCEWDSISNGKFKMIFFPICHPGHPFLLGELIKLGFKPQYHSLEHSFTAIHPPRPQGLSSYSLVHHSSISVFQQWHQCSALWNAKTTKSSFYQSSEAINSHKVLLNFLMEFTKYSGAHGKTNSQTTS